MDTMKTILHLLLFFTFPCVGLAADVPRQKQEDDIRETVFRYQFDNNASGQKTNAKVGPSAGHWGFSARLEAVP
jgi:hypothetical protein